MLTAVVEARRMMKLAMAVKEEAAEI